MNRTLSTTITNTDRAARIDAVLAAHAVAQNDHTPEDKAEAVQDLLTDLMHYCDTNGIDLDDCLNLADMTYQTEQEGPGPLPLPDPLIQPRT